MKNLERAKNYQKKLFDALGIKWNEDKFYNFWEGALLGDQWDHLYDEGLIEDNFCIWCGNDDLGEGHFRRHMWASRDIRFPICDNCFYEDNLINGELKKNK